PCDCDDRIVVRQNQQSLNCGLDRLVFRDAVMECVPILDLGVVNAVSDVTERSIQIDYYGGFFAFHLCWSCKLLSLNAVGGGCNMAYPPGSPCRRSEPPIFPGRKAIGMCPLLSIPVWRSTLAYP